MQTTIEDPAEARKAILSRWSARRSAARPRKPTRRESVVAWCAFACGFVLGALVGLVMGNVLRKW